MVHMLFFCESLIIFSGLLVYLGNAPIEWIPAGEKERAVFVTGLSAFFVIGNAIVVLLNRKVLKSEKNLDTLRSSNENY